MSSSDEKTMKAAFFDVDGTLTKTRVWQGLMTYFSQRGLRQGIHLAFLSIHYPLYFFRRLGIISEEGFRAPWIAHMGWYFRGYSEEQAEEIWDSVVNESINHLWREDVRDVLVGHISKGELVVLVSGGPVPLLKRLAREINVDHVVGTSFDVKNGRYTGRVLGQACVGKNKAIMVRKYLKEHELDVDFKTSHTYADSISDLSLLEMVGKPIATYPGENLRAFAQEHGWQIIPAPLKR